MPKLPVVKTRELIRILNRIGFFEHNQVGSHAQFKHLDGRRVTVPLHYGRDIKTGTLRGILNDIDVSVEEFISVLKKKK